MPCLWCKGDTAWRRVGLANQRRRRIAARKAGVWLVASARTQALAFLRLLYLFVFAGKDAATCRPFCSFLPHLGWQDGIMQFDYNTQLLVGRGVLEKLVNEVDVCEDHAAAAEPIQCQCVQRLPVGGNAQAQATMR